MGEINMEDNYWLDRWEKNDIGFHEQNINANLLAYFDKLNLQIGDRIFVPLCGKSKDMLWLAEKGLNVVGVELSPIACTEFFAELNVTPTITQQANYTKYQYDNIELFCGNLYDLTSIDLPTIHAVYDCKALIALPPDVRKKYIDHIVKCIGNKVRILLLTRESSCQITPPPFPINKTEINLLYGSYFDVQLLNCVSLTNILERLINKGYAEITESVYLISEKSN